MRPDGDAIAMAAATLHAVSGERFVLGLGASTPQLTQVRALLAGDRIPLAATRPQPLPSRRALYS